MVTQELDEMDPHKFRPELVKCLADYYENVRDMEGAGGLHCVKSFKRKIKDITLPPLWTSLKPFHRKRRMRKMAKAPETMLSRPERPRRWTRRLPRRWPRRRTRRRPPRRPLPRGGRGRGAHKNEVICA